LPQLNRPLPPVRARRRSSKIPPPIQRATSRSNIFIALGLRQGCSRATLVTPELVRRLHVAGFVVRA